MKSPAKIFVILAWGIALVGGAWGWARFVMSDEPVLPVLPPIQLSSEDLTKLAISQMPQPAVPVQPAPAQTAGSAQSADAHPVVNKNDFSCLKSMIWASKRTLDQYVAEKGYPKEQVDLKTQYAKTPVELQRNSFTAGTCHPQYLYCNATGCGYAISFMQAKGSRRSTMAASVMGSRSAQGPDKKWQVSCINQTDLGKQICLEYGAE